MQLWNSFTEQGSQLLWILELELINIEHIPSSFFGSSLLSYSVLLLSSQQGDVRIRKYKNLYFNHSVCFGLHVAIKVTKSLRMCSPPRKVGRHFHRRSAFELHLFFYFFKKGFNTILHCVPVSVLPLAFLEKVEHKEKCVWVKGLLGSSWVFSQKRVSINPYFLKQ